MIGLSFTVCWSIIVSVLQFMPVNGRGRISIRLMEFNNPRGKGDNGNCCDGVSIFCPSACDHQFTLCLHSLYTQTTDLNACRYGRSVTGEVINADYIKFGSSIGGTNNPIIFRVSSVPYYIRVKVGIWDVDSGSAYEFVDMLTSNIRLNPGKNGKWSTVNAYTLHRRVTLRINLSSSCDYNYYGNECNVLCQQDRGGHYTCNSNTGQKICRPGWHGLYCNTQVDDCASSPCHHGECIDLHRGYQCLCKPGYEGLTCSTWVNLCASRPCLNGGRCNQIETGVTCDCPVGFTGRLCSIDVDLCSGNPCKNSGTCQDIRYDFLCRCPAGFKGKMCEMDVNECSSQPCKHSGRCIDGRNRFTCLCAVGFTGPQCSTYLNCPCQNNGKCIDSTDGFNCSCPKGFNGKQCENIIHTCSETPCHNNGTCINLNGGGFLCTCDLSFTGTTCEGVVDPCQSGPCFNGATCTSNAGSFTCTCPVPFHGSTCSRRIDYCKEPICLNNGTCVQDSFKASCLCADVFTGRVCETEIRTCSSTSCLNNGSCVQTSEGPSCRCLDSYTGYHCETSIVYPNATTSGLSASTDALSTLTDGLSTSTYVLSASIDVPLATYVITTAQYPHILSTVSEAVPITKTVMSHSDISSIVSSSVEFLTTVGLSSTQFEIVASSVDTALPNFPATYINIMATPTIGESISSSMLDSSIATEITYSTRLPGHDVTSVDVKATITTQAIPSTSIDQTTVAPTCFPLFFKGKIDPEEKDNIDDLIKTMLIRTGGLDDRAEIKSHMTYFKSDNGDTVTEFSVEVFIGNEVIDQTEMTSICKMIETENFADAFPFGLYHGSLFPLASSSIQDEGTVSKITITIILASIAAALIMIGFTVIICYKKMRCGRKHPGTPELMSIDDECYHFENKLYQNANPPPSVKSHAFKNSSNSLS